MRTVDLSRIQSATSETARDINRRVVLNLIRNRQPVSRADLARLSGFQRSTVSLITEQLIEENWVSEGPTGRLPRGRRPTYLRLNEKRAVLGVDIRPLNTTIALADVNSRFITQEIFPTPGEFKPAIDQITGRLKQLMRSQKGYRFEGVGVSLPGRMDLETRRLVFAPNLGWRDVDIQAPIARATGLRVELENAANACALAEAWFGRNEGLRDLIAVTVSEGIGTGILLNGQLVRGPNGMAGEFGHTVLETGGPLCKCGNRGCWEVLASNSAGVRYYTESEHADGAPSFSDILALAAQGDVSAAKALNRMAYYLGLGTSRLVNGIAPACVVFVGELTRDWSRFGPAIEKEVRQRALAPVVARIIPSDDGSQARLRGTVALVLHQHFGAPTFV